MGYCPQHDAQWKNITVREHLECYAAIRGVPPSDVNRYVNVNIVLYLYRVIEMYTNFLYNIIMEASWKQLREKIWLMLCACISGW